MNRIKYMIVSAVLFCCIGALLPLAAQNKVLFRNTGEAVRYYENLVGMLTKQVRSMQDENAMTVSALRDLQKRLRTMEVDQNELRRELQDLRKQISADAESRRTQFNALADRIMKQPVAVSPSYGRKHDQGSASGSSSGRSPSRKTTGEEQEFIEHTVEAGTTLSALARAYKVSIRDIEKINKIKKGRIYAGQKLLIPVNRKK